MKVKVIKAFKDIHTGEMHKVGDEFTCTKKRYTEILSKGAFIEEVKEDKDETEATAEETAEETTE